MKRWSRGISLYRSSLTLRAETKEGRPKSTGILRRGLLNPPENVTTYRELARRSLIHCDVPPPNFMSTGASFTMYRSGRRRKTPFSLFNLQNSRLFHEWTLSTLCPRLRILGGIMNYIWN